MSRILIIDDESSIRLTLKEGLKDFDHKVKTAKNSKEAYEINNNFIPELIILDLNLGFESGMDLIDTLNENNPGVQIIILTAYGDIKTAVSAVKKGVFDFINKPLDIDELEYIIEKALDLKIMKSKIYLHEKEKELNKMNFIGDSLAMKKVFSDLLKVSKMKDVTVLIKGESGTGKELAAEYVYKKSPKYNKPYIKINCAALPNNLVESELFGYVKGAFTGADSEKIGLIEAANEGTIFLDEIGEISNEIQAKLLRVIENKKLMRVGSVKEIPVDVRIIAATNINLENAIEKGSFRKDLYYRLNVFPIVIPPLRNRKDDIKPLIDFFLEKNSKKFNKVIKASKSFVREAEKYNWPGNVRELKNIIERICIISDNKILTERDFIICNSKSNIDICKVDSFKMNNNFDLENELSKIEKKYIKKAIEESNNNITKASKRLNISRYSLMRRIEKYKL